MQRVNLSVAIIPMAKEFEWDDTVKGLVLSSFFWGYITNQLPGGWLATRFGGKVRGITAATINKILFDIFG